MQIWTKKLVVAVGGIGVARVIAYVVVLVIVGYKTLILLLLLPILWIIKRF